MTTSEDRLLEIQEIIGAKLIVFMEKNITRFVEDEDEQIAVTIATLTGVLSSFMGSISATHEKLDELREIVIADLDDSLRSAKLSISRRQNHDS